MTVTRIESHRLCHEDLFDEEAIAMRHSGDLSRNLRTVQICQKAKDSMALVRKPGPWMVLAGAGRRSSTEGDNL